jgi:hypothetical protein
VEWKNDLQIGEAGRKSHKNTQRVHWPWARNQLRNIRSNAIPKFGLQLKLTFQSILLPALLALLGELALKAQTVVYQTGFEGPGFVVGNLAGQNGWASGGSISQNAAQIVAVSGGQEVQLSGPQVALSGPSFYNASFNESLANYNPAASGTPIVEFSADLWQNQGPTTSQSSWQFSFLILNDQNGNAYGTIGIDQNGVVFGQNWSPTNQVVGDGSTATNGFHNVRLELNFTNRTTTLFKDGYACGTMAFNTASSNKLGSVVLVLQGGSPIDSSLFLDNLSITAGSATTPSPCDLQISSAGPCLVNGASGTPNVGDVYGLSVHLNVKGTPAQPFRIKWTIANVTYYYNNISVGPGSGYWWDFIWWLNLDDPIPWSVTLDPDGVSGDTNLVNNTASGTFTPVPPSSTVELYAPRMMGGMESSVLSFQPGSGTIPNFWVVFGSPTTHGAQKAISVTGPSNMTSTVTAPYGIPVFALAWSNTPAGTFQESVNFTAQLNNMRVNPNILRSVTWANMDALTTNWTQWLAPDSDVESTNVLISGFVQQSLPANYRTILTPYDTARTLHKAVAKKLVYGTAIHGDAVGVLQDGIANCGGFSTLLTACLRNVGIPARLISGFWQGDSWQGDDQWHIRVEFYLPGAGWLVADPTASHSFDPSGTFAYDFGFVPDANAFFAMDVGGAHILPYCNFGELQVPNFLWYGGATFNTNYALSFCQPLPTACISNSVGGFINLSLTNCPYEGSVVIQTSTNLMTWSAVVTNSTGSNVISYSYPNTNGPRRFYRANIIP